MKGLVIGIDVGGTNVKLGIINSQGKIISRSNLTTKSYIRNKNKLIGAIIDNIRSFILENNLKNKDIAGIGIGLPGLVDPIKGIVKFLPNVPGWKNVPLKEIMEKELKIDVFIDNDVNLITLGEWKFGAGKEVKNMVCMTLGTGVGSGLILNNELYRGEGYAAGELGHMPLNEEGPSCNCYGYGCFERYVGNKYLLEKIHKVFKNKDITLEEVSDLADQGNKRAIQIWEEMAMHIGNVLTGVVNLLNPSHIIIGGGVSRNYKYLFKLIREQVKKRAMKIPASMVNIKKAKLGNDAGIVGAQVLVYENIRRTMKKIR